MDNIESNSERLSLLLSLLSVICIIVFSIIFNKIYYNNYNIDVTAIVIECDETEIQDINNLNIFDRKVYNVTWSYTYDDVEYHFTELLSEEKLVGYEDTLCLNENDIEDKIWKSYKFSIESLLNSI